MAKLGYVALCPRNFLFNEGADLKGNTVKVLKDWPTAWHACYGMVFARWMSWPRCRRWMLTGLGCIGHSLGAEEALYLAAFDQRVKASVSSEGGVGLSMSNWEADWYSGRRSRPPASSMITTSCCALIAPRAYLWIGGDSADTNAGLDYLKAAQPVFSKTGVPGNVQFFNHRLGHAYPPVAREKNDAFLPKQLGQ